MIVHLYDKPGADRPLVTSRDPALIRLIWAELAGRLNPAVDDPLVLLRVLADWDRAQAMKGRRRRPAAAPAPDKAGPA